MLLKDLYHYYLIKRSGLFDANYYLLANPDVRLADVDPLWHFVRVGWKERRNPSKRFDTEFYIAHYDDVWEAQINPVIHYIKFGMNENRLTCQRITKIARTYQDWIELYDIITQKDRELIYDHIDTFSRKPLISILMPVFNTPAKYLREAIESVRAQLYPNWELCIADDCSTQPHIRKILDEYRQLDSRIKVAYRDINGHISAASNTALSLCSGEFIGFLDHDDILREHALYFVVNEINKFPEANIIYSDEDKIDDQDRRYDPYFKPDWNPDLFNQHNLISHFGVYSKSLVCQVGGFRTGFEGAQDWDLAMRITEMIPSNHIRHIPFILYHWRSARGSTAKCINEKNYAKEAQQRTIKTHFERLEKAVDILPISSEYWHIKYPIPKPYPLASLIIPTKNGMELISKCIESILIKTDYQNYEILIINNLSNDHKTLNYLHSTKNSDDIFVLDYLEPFNYSAINNFAVNHAKGDVLVFLNNDTEVISSNWLDEMVSNAMRPEIGAVGALLLYPDDRIQHAGVILGIAGVADHAFLNFNKNAPGQLGRARLTQNYSAITGACMAIQKSKFEEVKGFNEKDLAIAFNDIDLCIRLLQRGYRNLWTPHAKLYHHESATRGYEDTPEKIVRFNKEAQYMLATWGSILKADPTYNLNLSLEKHDFSLAFPPRVEKPWKNRQPLYHG